MYDGNSDSAFGIIHEKLCKILSKVIDSKTGLFPRLPENESISLCVRACACIYVNAHTCKLVKKFLYGFENEREEL